MMRAPAQVFRNKTALIKELITSGDIVLDVGFWGQGVNPVHSNWVHNILRSRAKETYGIDLNYDASVLEPTSHYKKASAEDFCFERSFDVIFAGDLIEHLPNPGLFLDSAKKHLAPRGRLVITTPNAFNLFTISEKLSKGEPTVNPDHTCYFNVKTLSQLLEKCGWQVASVGYIYSLDLAQRESWKKRALNALYAVLAHFTTSYLETLVIVASPLEEVNRISA